MLLGQALKNWGQLAGYGARRALGGGLGQAATGAAWGGIMGAGYGAMSNDTSMIGGALMGAAAGAGISRYGGPIARSYAGFRNAGYGVGKSGLNAARFSSALFRSDARGVALAANRGFNRVRSSMKGWGAGAGGGI